MPGTPAARPERGAPFGQVLRAEWTKFRTVRGWVIGVIVAPRGRLSCSWQPRRRCGHGTRDGRPS
jgi:hypothetical protein